MLLTILNTLATHQTRFERTTCMHETEDWTSQDNNSFYGMMLVMNWRSGAYSQGQGDVKLLAK